ncbi:hypothetical protein V2E67_001916 [Citrobacter freundii]|nr:hypothetical protein [Citrobacter freundii]
MKISNNVMPERPILSKNIDEHSIPTATKFNEQLKDVNQTSQKPHKSHNIVYKGIRTALHVISAIRILLSHKNTTKDNVQATEHFEKTASVRHNLQSDVLFSSGIKSSASPTVEKQTIEKKQNQKGSIPQPPPLPSTSVTQTKTVVSLADAIAQAKLKHGQNQDEPRPASKELQTDFMAQLKARLSSMDATGDDSSTGQPLNKIQQEIAELRKEYQSEAAVQKREESEARMEARVSAAIKAEEEAEADARAATQVKEFIAEVKHDSKGIPLPPPMPVGLLSTQQGKPQITPTSTAKIATAGKGQYHIDPEIAKKHGGLVNELNALFAKRANRNLEIHDSQTKNNTGDTIAAKEEIKPRIDQEPQLSMSTNRDSKGIPVPPPLPLN